VRLLLSLHSVQADQGPHCAGRFGRGGRVGLVCFGVVVLGVVTLGVVVRAVVVLGIEVVVGRFVGTGVWHMGPLNPLGQEHFG